MLAVTGIQVKTVQPQCPDGRHQGCEATSGYTQPWTLGTLLSAPFPTWEVLRAEQRPALCRSEWVSGPAHTHKRQEDASPLWSSCNRAPVPKMVQCGYGEATVSVPSVEGQVCPKGPVSGLPSSGCAAMCLDQAIGEGVLLWLYPRQGAKGWMDGPP